VTATEPLLSLRDAEVRLGARTIWSDVTVDVGPGQFVAVLGPNGVGKSTLLKVVLGLVPLAAGEVRVCGRPPGRGNPGVGYLPQRRSFDGSTRVRGVDVVRLGVDGDRWGVPLPARIGNRSRAAARRVDELVGLVGAGGFAERPIGTLSGGEQQRLLIAQALARRPRLLLLDEPLDSLDLASQVSVAGLLEEICEGEDLAVVIVAHDVNPIITYLDQVVYLANGGAASGRPREVVTGETLSKLYGTPIEVLEASDGRLVVVGSPDVASYHPGLHAHHH
jgi:zinc/manganese transport system ATP-binding protein